MGTVSDSSVVKIPPEAATALRDAIRSARVAFVTLEPWLERQPLPTKKVITRMLGWWVRSLAVTEPIIVQSLEDES